jgi:glc operon protein GlcG
LLLIFVTIGHARGQQPPTNPLSGGTPDKIPFDTPHGSPINLQRAKQAVAAAEGEAQKRNWNMSIAVVDPNGELIYFVRMDDAMVASVSVSQAKARTSARALVASLGGLPLVEFGKLTGAIGCSGRSGDQDALICKVGADLFK